MPSWPSSPISASDTMSVSISVSRVSLASESSCDSSARVSVDWSWPPASCSCSSPSSPGCSSSCCSSLSSEASGSASGSAPRPRSDSTRRITCANAAWSPCVLTSSSRWLPARASMSPRTRSIAVSAILGTGCPVNRSRTTRPSAVASGTSSAERARTIGSARTRISVMRSRFLATPAISCDPSASTRACSTAFQMSRASPASGWSTPCSFTS